METQLFYFVAGLLAGVLAGVFGIGGGLTIVPILYLMLPRLGVAHGLVMHLAIGTSLAVMIVTTVESTYVHNCSGDVLWPVIRRLAPTVALGALVAAVATRWIATDVLRYFFIALVAYTIVRALTKKGFADRYELTDFTAPPLSLCLPVGFGVGVVSALLGTGGSPMTVPFLRAYKLRMANAAAAASALAVPIAVLGTIGYVVTGWHDLGLPSGATGYVYWPAAPGLLVGILIGVPVGTRISERLSDRVLARAYIVFLGVVLVAMIV
jgi:uncharacterized membrane protein YfcA